MRLMFASDIHGSAAWCKRLLEAWRQEKPERLVLLGDLLYHGPRNDLPEEYAPKKVITMLNDIAPHLLCVRGNCEAEVDQMVFSFPVMADYCVLLVDGHTVYATHGHVYNEDNPPPLQPGDILLCGHTHIPCCHHHETFTYVNPGSVSIPKQDSPHSYIMLEDGRMTWKDMDGRKFMEEKIW